MILFNTRTDVTQYEDTDSTLDGTGIGSEQTQAGVISTGSVVTVPYRANHVRWRALSPG